MKLAIGGFLLFVGALLFALPDLTPRNVLFGSAVAPDFRRGPLARKSVAQFRILIAGTLALLVSALFLSPPSVLTLLFAGGPLVLLGAALLGFLHQHRRVAPFAVDSSTVRRVSLSGLPDVLPWYVWTAIIPFAALACAAAYLHAHYRQIPVHFPVHWGLDGRPNRWSTRSLLGVYGPLLFAAELCAWMVVSGLASWFGARRSHLRRAGLGAMIVCEFLIAFLLAAVTLSPLLHVPLLTVTIVLLVLSLPWFIALARATKDPHDPPEPTPNSAWKGGLLYYNRSDPALVVEKRVGLGYTLNFGNRWSWALALSLVCILLTAPWLT